MSGPTLMAIFSAADAGAPLGQSAHTLIEVGLDQIVPCRWQPRQVFDAAALLDLARDIELHGVLTPPLVWANEAGEYELIAGERRVRACYALYLAGRNRIAGMGLDHWIERLAKEGFAKWRKDVRMDTNSHVKVLGNHNAFSAIPCREVWGSVAQLHELALVDNLQRADLSALEEARALKDLIEEYGYSQRDLAARLGKSQTWVSQRLVLLNLTPEVAAQVLAGEIEASVGRDIGRIPQGVQAAVAAHLLKHGMKQKAAANFVSRLLQLTTPEAWVEIAGEDLRRYGLVLQEFMRRQDEAARFRLVLGRLAKDMTQGRLPMPTDSFMFDEVLYDLGISPGRYGGLATAWVRLFGESKATDAAQADKRIEEPQAESTTEDEDGQTRTEMDTGQAARAYQGDRAPGPQWVEIPQGVSFAEAAGVPTCATCVLNEHRDLVAQALAAYGKINERPASTDPKCEPGVTTCPIHTPVGAKAKFELMWASRDLIREDEWPGIIERNGAYGNKLLQTEHVGLWATLLLRRVNSVLAKRAESERQDREGIVNALRRYVAVQPRITAGHVYSQPCARCAFGREGADEGCALISRPELRPKYWRAFTVAALWGVGDYEEMIGRCGAFRLVNLAALPVVPGMRLGMSYGFLLAVLHDLGRTNYGTTFQAPAWINVERKELFEAPSWSDAEGYIKRAISALNPSELGSVLAAWVCRLALDGTTDQKVVDPHRGKEVTWRQVKAFRTDDKAGASGD